MNTSITSKEMANIAIELIIVSLISLIALLFCIYCYLKFEELQNTQFQIAIRIITSDLIYTVIIFLIGIAYLFLKDQPPLNDTHYYICQMEAFMSNFSILSSAGWTSIICFNLYNVVFHNNNKHYYYQYFLVGYFLPLIIAYTPFYFNAYGSSYPLPQSNCFFTDYTTLENIYIYIYLFYYVPIYSAFIFNLAVMVLVVRKLRVSDQESKQYYALLVYPSILATCWILPSIIGQLHIPTIIWTYFIEFLCNIIGLLDSLCYCYLEIFKVLEFKHFRLVRIHQDTAPQMNLYSVNL